jgi:pimeloyl-ACP methyl ester carboxylesterase
VRQGSAGCARDLAHYLRAWDFCVEKIEAPLTFWHGERDAIVPAAMSRNLASRISHAAANYLPEEGHYSVVMSHAPKILRELRERSVASA